MESTVNDNPSAKIITALIIGLIVGFLAGAFWQARRISTPVTDTTAAAIESTGTNKTALDTTAKNETKVNEKKETAGEAKAATTPMLSAATTVASSGALAVKVIDQLAGDVVVISVTGVAEPIWVAVRETKDGKTGNILGARKVFVGEDASTVQLLRPTVAGGTYTAVLYKDVGDPTFNYREDVLILGVEGRFTAK